jgi:hypothetical protein
MGEVLKVATNVATPLALLGLVAALAYFAYNRRLRHAEKQLESLPEAERARITDEYLTRYGIDGAKLRLADKLALIKDELDKRHRRSLSYVIVSAVVFVTCFGLAVFAYVRTTPANNGRTVIPEPHGPRQITSPQSAKGDLFQTSAFLAGKAQDFPGMSDAIPLVGELPDHARGQFICSEVTTTELTNPRVTVRGIRTSLEVTNIEVFLFAPAGQPDSQLHESTQEVVNGQATLRFEGTLPAQSVIFVVGWVESPDAELDWSHLSIWVE